MTDSVSTRAYEAPRIHERTKIDAPLVLTLVSNVDGTE
jgi:hypothetical protein